jgi:ribosomal protein S16
MRLFEIIFEGYKEAQAEFGAASDADTAKKYIEQYKSLVNRNQVKGDERNIDWWRKQGFEKFKSFVDSKSQEKSITQVKRSKDVGKSHTLMENDTWLIVIPLDKDASCFHGKNTDWCTTKPFQPYFEDYFYNKDVTLVYCLHKKTGDKWAIAAHVKLTEAEYFDKNDKSLNKSQFDQQTALPSDKIIKMALADNIQTPINKERKIYKKYIKEIKRRLDSGLVDRDTELEKMLWFTKSRKVRTYFEELGKRSDYPLKLQLMAVNQYGSAIEYIKNPKESVQLSAVKQVGGAIEHIENPSEAVQLAAVQERGIAIEHIENPSEAVQLAAVQNHRYAILFIKNPSEDIQLASVQQNSDSIKFIIENGITPSEPVQLAAVQQDVWVIRYINNPSEDVQLAAVQKNGRAIQFIENPSEDVQLAAVQQNGSAIEYIIKKGITPSEEVQIAAVQKFGGVIRFIDNPSEKVKAAHKEKWG